MFILVNIINDWVIKTDSHKSNKNTNELIPNEHFAMMPDVLNLMERGFERLGRFVAKYPLVVIILCLLWSGLSCIGFIFTTVSTNTYDIWDTNPTKNPAGSQSVAHKEWISKLFGDNLHTHTLIFSATDLDEGNILSPEALKVMLEIHNSISQERQTVSFQDICHR